ncbi:similar to TRICHOME BIREFRINGENCE-LIKE 4 [Actinidia rufa]|uniref:Similar to TRICHOME BIREFRINGENCE-LIKE 4 n=1 Tax=Actinidia rufa TaxID=165716 RepID=A0A7J0DZF5_9ERIC|nr:similar to TRICHOME BIREFRINGENCE-LIKE 4 [Actinidia rufa]
MDTNSTINRTWKLCAFTSFIGCLILTLSLNQPPQQCSVLGFSNPFDNYNIIRGYEKQPVENPLYDEFQCPFLSDQVSCQRNGRPDFGYESWSWEANDCQIPRFDGKDLLERLRGKRVIIVGDSLNRNQWESLACLLYSVVPSSRAHVDVQSGVYKVFRAKDYNCSVEFYWSPFLIQLDTNQANGTRVLRLDKIVASAQHWRGADVMVFNTWSLVGSHREVKGVGLVSIQGKIDQGDGYRISVPEHHESIRVPERCTSDGVCNDEREGEDREATEADQSLWPIAATGACQGYRIRGTGYCIHFCFLNTSPDSYSSSHEVV